MKPSFALRLMAALLVLGLHAAALRLADAVLHGLGAAKPARAERMVIHLTLPPLAREAEPPPPKRRPPPRPPQPQAQPERSPLQNPVAVAPHTPASRAAPPPPTAEEWAFAARYTLRNSKGYRHSWGQQLRSLMGTAIEGPDQGAVRFRIEIAPDGTLTRVDTLWTTSAAVERRAREALGRMPPLPPTPTGKPLIFERTIHFSPDAHDDPPTYDHDCLPQAKAFRNPFVWDGKSPQRRPEPEPEEPPDPQALQDCLKQLPQNTIEAEAARDRRAMERWGWTSGSGDAQR
jgi:TonB family protein